MTQRTNNKVSRRVFLRSAAVGAAGLLVAACQPTEKIVEKVVTKEVEKLVEVTRAPEGELVVRVLLDAWMCDLMALLPAVQRYNEKYKGKIRIEGDRTPQGWETKVLQMVREGKPYWNAKWHMTQFFDMRRMVETGLIQPVEPYVEASSLPWATKYKEMTTPQVYEAGFYEGHQYGMSDYVSRNVVIYRKDYLEEAGWEKPPDTWDEFTQCARDIKAKLSDRNIVAIGPEPPYRRSLHSAFLGWVNSYDEAYDASDHDKVRYTSDKFKEATALFRSWFDEGLTHLDAWQNSGEYMEKGLTAMHIGAEFRVPTVRNIWGRDKLDAVNIPVPKAGMPSRTNWEADIPVIFRNAEYPQEAFDWICEMLAWEGEVAEVWQRFAAYNFGLLTPYPSLNKELFTGKPEHEWLVKSEVMVTNSWVTPRNVSFVVIGDKLGAYLDKIWARQLEIDEAIQMADKEINEEIGKQIERIKQT
jgi:ABC-type glycerol-3-phosphate transport system substrate-binding protein